MDHNATMAVDLQALRQSRWAILDIAARRGALGVRVFGSVARGEVTAASDVDLLVNFEAGRGWSFRTRCPHSG
ncbi:MAG: nucleotidyltransferase family protein [Pseudonocardia sp.]